MKNRCILLLGLVGAAAQDPAEVCPDENTACLGSQPCADLIENGTPDAALCAANDLCTALTTCLDAASDSGGGGSGGGGGGGEQTCGQCHDACGCDCNDQGCGDQTCQDCHSACDSGVCGSGGGGGGDGSGAGDGSGGGGGGGGGGGDGGESTGSATGACGTTDREVADLCNVPGGVCHSFCVSSDASSTACDYRGSYVGPLVSFHDQGTAAEAAGGDMSATKIYRFAPPAFVGFPNNCNGPEFYEAVDASGSEFLAAGRKHVSFELYETTCSMTTEVAETIAEGEFKCETPMVPPILLAETAPESETAGKSVMTGKSFGVDLNSVRDKVSYRTDTQTDQTLMYQLFLRPASISKINFGDISAAPRVCIQPECAAKSVTAGQFKFTVGTEIDDAVLVADTVRLVFKIALENGVEADGDALDATLGEQGRFLFSSPTATSEGSKVDFTVDFARNFLYGSYDSSTAAFDTGLGIGLASVSIEQTGLSAVVNVDLELNDDLKTACAGANCMLLYDPDLAIGGDVGDPPAQVGAMIAKTSGAGTPGGQGAAGLLSAVGVAMASLLL